MSRQAPFLDGLLLRGWDRLHATDTAEDKSRATVTFTFPKTLPAGSEAELVIVFSAALSDKLSGFYRSSYKDAKTGETRWDACGLWVQQ